MEYHKIETLFERDKTTFKVNSKVVKNRAYTLLKEWQFTEKIDGTNIRCIWKDGVLTFGGKTDNAQLHTELLRWLQENVKPGKLAEIFPDVTNVVLYGEGYGAGIQKGGGAYSPVKKFIMFDVLVDSKWWLNHESVCDVASKLGLDVVPFIGSMSLEDATEMVRSGFVSKLGDRPAEGVVGRPAETLFDKKGHRLILKLKTNDF